MLHRAKKMEPFKQVIFVLLIGSAVIAFWRGVWGLLDTYLLPDNYELSSWLSVIIGFLILLITHHLTKELE